MTGLFTTHGYLAAFLSFAACAALLPLVRRFAFYFRVHDQPGHLKIHNVPIPRLGGVAMMLAIVLGLVVSTYGAPVHLVHFYFALGLICDAGFVDHLLHLRL